MTDLERFKELYSSFGIELKEEKDDDTGEVNIDFGDAYLGELLNTSEKFDGYTGFFTSVLFSKDGKFIKQGF